MPFKSVKQRTWMKMNKPKLYKKWSKKYSKKIGGVKHVNKKRRRG